MVQAGRVFGPGDEVDGAAPAPRRCPGLRAPAADTRPAWPGSGRWRPPSGRWSSCGSSRSPRQEACVSGTRYAAADCVAIRGEAVSDQTTVMPEYQPQPEPRRSRGGLIAVVASVVAVVLVAAGGFAAWRFLGGGGPRPAEVLPASTFALLTRRPGPVGRPEGRGDQDAAQVPDLPRGERTEAGLRPDQAPLRGDPARRASARTSTTTATSSPGSASGPASAAWSSTASPRPSRPSRSATPRTPRAGSRGSPKCAELEGDDFGWTLSDDYIVISDSTEHARRRSRRRARRRRCRRTRTSRSGPRRRAVPGS